MMKNLLSLATLLIALLLLEDCTPKPAPECVYKDCMCEDSVAVTDSTHFWPFNRNYKAVVYEYNVPMSAQRLRLDTGNIFAPLNIKTSHALNDGEILQLEKICMNRTEHCNDYTCEEGNNCLYDPRHCIVFFEGDKPAAYLELCFTCDDYRSWPTDAFGTKCGDFMHDIRWLLHKMSFDDTRLYFDMTNGYVADTGEVWKGHFTKTP